MNNPEAVTEIDNRIANWQDIIRSAKRVRIVGGRSKTGFYPIESEAAIINTSQRSGVVSYDPQEFVVTVLAGTTVSELQSLLNSKRQYLPFDPLLAQRGATIGGTIASNANGPGRFRFGGVRDFVIGVRFLDGCGNYLRGGGNVVKNAAGFDYPKLMVGSRGRFGVLCEVTLKVFPMPEEYATLLCYFSSTKEAIDAMQKIGGQSLDLECLDLVPLVDERFIELVVRVGGLADAMPARLSRLQSMLPPCRILRYDQDQSYWNRVTNFEWVPKATAQVWKLPINSRQIDNLESSLSHTQIGRRYSVGGNVLWLASTTSEANSQIFTEAQLFLGSQSLAAQTTEPLFGKLIRSVLDPDCKFN